MVKRLTLKPHLRTAGIEREYRRATDPVARSQWQILWLVARGQPTPAVVASTGYSPTWVYQIVRRYNAGGAAGVGDRRRQNPGAAPLLDAAGQADLRAALAGPAPGGAPWGGPAVAAWLAERLGRPVGAQRGWEYLRRLGRTPQVPRPAHAQADPAAQDAFKRGASRTP
jgi:transposase